MKNGLTASQLVHEWSGTNGQLNCNVPLYDVVNSEEIPVIVDVSRSFGNAVAIEIITNHLHSVLQFSGVELTAPQLAETSLAILSGYWYLNLAELCIFFTRLKSGSFGQFVWGSKINNQAIMVALYDFILDRRKVIEKQENEKKKQEVERGFIKIENAAAAIVTGLDKFKELKAQAKDNLEAFSELYPYLPERLSRETWWKAWLGDPEALKRVYGENVPPVKIAIEDIGKYLCEYTNAKAKEYERNDHKKTRY